MMSAPNYYSQNRSNPEREGPLNVRAFTGEGAVSRRAAQLRQKNKAIDRAMGDAERRGRRPAFEHGRIIWANDPGKTATPQVPFIAISFKPSLRNDIFTDGDVEIMFIPYDSGNPAIWEGIIYRSVPSIGEDTYWAVINIADVPDVTQEEFYPPDGGDPLPILLMAQAKQLLDPINSRAIHAYNPENWSSLSDVQAPDTFLKVSAPMRAKSLPLCPTGFHRCLGTQNGECCINGGLPGLNGWVRRAAAGCGAAAIGCVVSGPAWAGCCTGAMFAALFTW